MGLLDFFFGKDKKEEQDLKTHESPGYEPGIDTVQVDKVKNIVRTKCACGHKKAKVTSDGYIKCRSCKCVIGTAV